MNRKIFIAVLVFAVLMSINFALEIDPDCIVGYGTDELKVIANSGTCENTFTAKCDEVDAAPPTCCKKPGACDISGVDCVDVVGGNGIRGTFDCSSFDNMEKACESAPGDSCVWNPTPTPGGCTGSGCKKLGDACIPLDNDCLTPLECVDGFCSQPGGTCTILPRIYSATLGSEGTSIGNTPDKKVEELTTGSGQFTGEMFQTQWFSDWKAAGLVGIMIAVLIIALAAMIGHAFNLPEIKAFAAAELSQAIISVLLVISLVALLVFFDSQSAAVLGAAQLPVSCSTIEPCYMTAAKFYIDTQLNMSKDIASDQLKISFDYQYRASQGYLTQANKWWLLFMGVSIRPNAGDSLVAERAGTMYSNASKLATSLMAQEYFINVVSFGIAPIFLLLGIVLRTFFFTRKLGGLLLAIAVSLFFVYPLTYAFAWYTLNTTVYGERTVSVSDPACPAECTTPHPAAFFINKNGEIEQFATTQSIMLAGINDVTWKTGDVNEDGKSEFPGLTACQDLTKAVISAPNSCSGCPDYCRESPMPQLPGCDATECEKCNDGCKIVRQRFECTGLGKNCDCKEECRTRLPMEGHCYLNDTTAALKAIPQNGNANCGGECSYFPEWCKEVKIDSEGHVSMRYSDDACYNDTIKKTAYEACGLDCVYSTTNSACDKKCKGCPDACRVSNLDDPDWVFKYAKDEIGSMCLSNSAVYSACKACPSSCKATLIDPIDINEEEENSFKYCAAFPMSSSFMEIAGKCTACPEYCRFATFGSVFTKYSTVLRDATDGTPYVCNESAGSYCSPDYFVPTPAQCQADCSGPGIDQEDYQDCYDKCISTVDEPDCADTCKNPGTPAPKICMPYDQSASSSDRCQKCPEVMRQSITLKYGTAAVAPRFISYSCSNSDCGLECQGGSMIVNLPDTTTNADCKPYYDPLDLSKQNDNSFCPYDCRVKGTASQYIDDNCKDTFYYYNMFYQPDPKADLYNPVKYYSPYGPGSTYTGATVDIGGNVYAYLPDLLGAHSPVKGCDAPDMGNSDPLPDECKVDLDADAVPICKPYENGLGSAVTKSCHNAYCYPIMNEDLCNKNAYMGCAWDTDAKVCDDNVCTNKATEQDCNGALACTFATDRTPVIGTADRSACSKCPENCRIITNSEIYNGDCGILNNGNNDYTDCSEQNCGRDCRVEVPPPPENAECQGYALKPDLTACAKCPALCRRTKDVLDKEISSGTTLRDICSTYPGCSANPVSGAVCGITCRTEAFDELKMCSGCYDCDYDCNYFPAIRTDCTELCSEEALAGPLDIGPKDFVNALPGAATSMTDARNIGNLYVPGVVLPLFCIVLTLSFVRIFSPILGGDMEIPGLGRII